MGSTDRCEIVAIDGGYTVTASNLAPYQNVTLAIGFESGTFAAYEPSLLERLVAIWVLIAAATGAVLGAYMGGALNIPGQRRQPNQPAPQPQPAPQQPQPAPQPQAATGAPQ